MQTEDMIEIEVALGKIQAHIFNDEKLFPVWLSVKRARELIGKIIRGEE